MKSRKIGETLKKYRKLRGWTVNDVALKLHDLYKIDVSGKTIYGWESDQSLPRSQPLLTLCELYQIDTLSPKQPTSPTTETFPITPDERELIKQYRQHPEVQQVIWRILNT